MQEKKAAACLELASQQDPASAKEQQDKSLRAPRCRLSQAIACRGLNLSAVQSSLTGALTTSWGSASLRGREGQSDAKSCVPTAALLPSLLLLLLFLLLICDSSPSSSPQHLHVLPKIQLPHHRRGKKRVERERRGGQGRKTCFPLMSLTHCHIRSIYRQKLSFCFPDLLRVLPPLCVMQQAAESIPAMDTLKETFGKFIS